MVLIDVYPHEVSQRWKGSARLVAVLLLRHGGVDPTIKERLADLGGAPIPMTPAEFGKLIAAETEKWGKVIRAAGIEAE
jgi:hypothetical protein